MRTSYVGVASEWVAHLKKETFFFFQAEDGIRDYKVTGVQTCALPIYHVNAALGLLRLQAGHAQVRRHGRSEEHTSELQSPCNLVCRLLLEKKKRKRKMAQARSKGSSTRAS